MDFDFNLKPVRPRVANMVDFELDFPFDRPILIGHEVRNRVGRYGIEDRHNLLGVYRTTPYRSGKKVQRHPFYRPRNPRSPAQQANRQRFLNVVAAWRALSDDEKMMYTEEGKRYNLIGYIYFCRQELRK